MENKRYQILLTNDDGIMSPGLWAAAEALSELGYVTVAAPRDQASSTGRSQPLSSDGKIALTKMQIGSQEWDVYAVGGTPAQVVVHSVFEIMSARPDLVVSGINYGENLGTSVTISGTIGATLEAASMGIPAIAASLQLADGKDYLSYSKTVDFSTAAHFVQYFARLMLEKRMPADVDVLKIDVPFKATPETEWQISRQDRQRYYVPFLKEDGDGNGDWKSKLDFRLEVHPELSPSDSDITVVCINHKVSVTPLSIDMTSRVNFDELSALLRK
ncbi:MAG: 5'/3'-nucleotidase SurE [Anaerolineaceae bacterium]|nr:5'/3'-nucleotidase SurE [Anaerolineaceae bacterium]